jgi:cobyrinic acid a,c-diamide synthase
MRINSVKMIVA